MKVTLAYGFLINKMNLNNIDKDILGFLYTGWLSAHNGYTARECGESESKLNSYNLIIYVEDEMTCKYGTTIKGRWYVFHHKLGMYGRYLGPPGEAANAFLRLEL